MGLALLALGLSGGLLLMPAKGSKKRVLSDEICDRCLCEAPCACPGGQPFSNGAGGES